AYASKNVLGANGSTLSVTAFTVNDGNTGGNYTVTSNGTAAGTITPRAITVTAAADTKIYDGGLTAVTAPTFPALQGTDTSGFSEAYSSKNVGTNLTLTPSGLVNDGFGGADYSYTYTAANVGTITTRAITVTAAANTKVYDGGLTATATPTMSGLQTGDTGNFSEAYTSKNVGTNLTLTPSGLVNDGVGGTDYSYTFTAANVGTITAAALTIAPVSASKTYDGGTTSTATPTVTGLQGTDTATGLTEAYASKNVLGANGSTLSG